MSVEVLFLGTGDAFGSGGRLHAAALVTAGATRVLVDCGPSTLSALRAHGVDPRSVDAILLTHLHGDHFGGVPFLLMDAHYAAKRSRPLAVAGPPGLEDRIARAQEDLFAGHGRLPLAFPLSYIELDDRLLAGVAGLTVTAFTVAHAQELTCFGLRIGAAGRTLSFSGDTEWTASLVDLAAGADLFVCECYGYDTAPPHHLDFRTLTAHRPELACRRLMLTHMGDDMLARAGTLDVEMAHDGLVIRI